MISLRYLGNEESPAPRLHDVALFDPTEFLQAVVVGVEVLARAGVVHGDLSAFNILVHDGSPWFIDFSESIRVDRTGGSAWVRFNQAQDALARGGRALATYFRRYRVAFDAAGFADSIAASLERFKTVR
jgi:RIO kinase 1